MAELTFEHIYKQFDGDVTAISDFHMDVADEEFIVLVGPSGCGKSTMLRMIAGLERITAGSLYIDQKYVNDIAPKDRDTAMVFQSYALYPHMNVFDNMAFGLKLQNLSKAEIKARVYNAGHILGLGDYLQRKPKALSGGQQQRVALGRAMVSNPKVFLMDEPLSNLDAKLRVQMRSEIIKLHQQLKTTTIYVTHDQTEAMTMASRIVVMKDGCIQQIGTPGEVYLHPENTFVGGFIGSPAMNFLQGTISEGHFRGGNQLALKLPEERLGNLKTYEGKAITLGIRPEDLHDEHSFPGSVANVTIDIAELTGSEVVLYTHIDNQAITATVNPRRHFAQGDQIELSFEMGKAHFFNPNSGKRIK
ncbi:sn-glycerol-3-phosphate ABC transporter ATP-binding protein UgpC [Salicibibacter cibarius]|uniref:sn-glycerol-3-phosphate ABC transporter ATP-binding protein UgpC n=1 Tax=Salicibibacter cibarius TaxID=2743000 RepID=A0A7T6Z0J0_9BACI|nr:sn-glycerol-3-phosphate ABC transporter ATP-binding protein UgpC [Salicibibacter cibarius]QQK74664.1 sn-glycerol-3-phosphate ABC transporter ATP-binding protein UgpC [Salicibibacter cibarius]